MDNTLATLAPLVQPVHCSLRVSVDKDPALYTFLTSLPNGAIAEGVRDALRFYLEATNHQALDPEYQKQSAMRSIQATLARLGPESVDAVISPSNGVATAATVAKASTIGGNALPRTVSSTEVKGVIEPPPSIPTQERSSVAKAEAAPESAASDLTGLTPEAPRKIPRMVQAMFDRADGKIP